MSKLKLFRMLKSSRESIGIQLKKKKKLTFMSVFLYLLKKEGISAPWYMAESSRSRCSSLHVYTEGI